MVMRPQAETAQIDQSTRNPSESFEDFFAECYEPLLRALYLVTGDSYEAEELAQEACFRVYGRWERLQGTANPRGYAYRAALNMRRSRLRRLATAARRTFRRDEPDALRSVDERDAIRRALAAIPVSQREALGSLGLGRPIRPGGGRDPSDPSRGGADAGLTGAARAEAANGAR